MDMPATPPGSAGFFPPDSLWWIRDRFFQFANPQRVAKDYNRPAYCLGLAEPRIHAIPASRFQMGDAFKEWSKAQPWTLFLAAGTFHKLAEASLLLVNFHQHLPAREVIFAGPVFLEMAPSDVKAKVHEKMREYIDACFA